MILAARLDCAKRGEEMELMKWLKFGAAFGLARLLAITALGAVMAGILVAFGIISAGTAIPGGLVLGAIAVPVLVSTILVAMLWSMLFMILGGVIKKFTNKVWNPDNEVLKIWFPYAVASFTIGFLLAPVLSILTLVLFGFDIVFVWLTILGLKQLKMSSWVPTGG